MKSYRIALSEKHLNSAIGALQVLQDFLTDQALEDVKAATKELIRQKKDQVSAESFIPRSGYFPRPAKTLIDLVGEANEKHVLTDGF